MKDEEKKKDGGELKSGLEDGKQYFAISKMPIRDPNLPQTDTVFPMYSKRDIGRFLAHPERFEKQLRKAIQYIYASSPHFRRLIQYFSTLSDMSYIVEPYKIDPKNTNAKTLGINYRRTLKALAAMNIKSQFAKIITICLKEDVFYGTLWVTDNHITLQRLPSDYCTISSVEENVPNVSFDFRYFSRHPEMLMNYPEEFRIKYTEYRKALSGVDAKKRVRITPWIELDSPTSFAVKYNSDILTYAIPPFAGILREVYDIEEYKRLKLSRAAIENYAMLWMKLPMDKDGNWLIDYKKAKDFWSNLDAVLPDEIGSVLTPMDIEKIGFEKNNNSGDDDTITGAEQNLFTAAGVSSLLFNNTKASANALNLSIKADQGITYTIVKGIEDAINRYIQHQKYGKNFRVNFLDCSPYNRKEYGDACLKAASYGLPMISMYAASQGLDQEELDAMSFLETDVLQLQDTFKPLVSSSQMSSSDLDSEAATDEGGAPTKGIGEISESGEANQEGS